MPDMGLNGGSTSTLLYGSPPPTALVRLRSVTINEGVRRKVSRIPVTSVVNVYLQVGGKAML